MRTKHLTHFLHRTKLQTVALGIVCSMAAFTVGLETAGDVHPYDTTQAAVSAMEDIPRVAQRGDIDNDGIVTVNDAIVLINVAEGIETATPEMVKRGDADGDFRITYKDAIRVLYSLSR